MKSKTTPYPFYDLSNNHFQNAELVLKDNVIIAGQFVQFKIVSGTFESLYPAEKFCFLPEEYKTTFWKSFNSNDGEFSKFPEYIKQFGFNDIVKIIIEPKQIV